MFVETAVVDVALAQILQSASLHAFVVVVYRFMPDHLHLLPAGQSPGADLIAFAKDVKQRVGYHSPLPRAGTIWQRGYYERILRDDEATLTVAKYILENPVRKGLVQQPRDYPFSGSALWNWDQLVEMWQVEGRSFRTA